MANKGPTLLQDQVLFGDDYLQSPNGQYVAYMQDDANFVLYHVSSTGSFTNPYWSVYGSATSNLIGTPQGRGGYCARMQNDGNFVLDEIGSPGPYWAIRYAGAGVGSYHLDMQDDGNLVIYNGSGAGATALWATNTVAGVGQKLTIASGNHQTQPRLSNPPGAATATFGPLSVRLTDNIGNPLSGKQVTWSVSGIPASSSTWPGPDMSVNLSMTGSPSATSTTDANGIAILNQLNGSSAQAAYQDGTFTVAASSDSATVTFNLTVGGLWAFIVSGNGQSVAPSANGRALFAPLQVQVIYAATYPATSQPVSGVEVRCFVDQGTSTKVQLQADGALSAIAVTDSNGIATFNQLQASINIYPYYGGTFTVRCTTASGNTVTFVETVTQ